MLESKEFVEVALVTLELPVRVCETALGMGSKRAGQGSEDKGSPHQHRRVSLRTIGDYLGLTAATVSLVINNSPGADAIPQQTKDRVIEAARKFNYRPNFVARSLRARRSFTIGVVVPEISEGYASLVLSGIEDHLLDEGYFHIVVSHRHRPDLRNNFSRLLLDRAVEGIIAVDTPTPSGMPVPVVAISGRNDAPDVVNIVLNHEKAAELALRHLYDLGHRSIAFIKGQDFSSDTEMRWNAIIEVAKRLKLHVSPTLTAQLEGCTPSPQPGFEATQRLLAKGERFTALFAFNDVSAVGGIRALSQAGLRVPEHVSVVGFDDIQSAAYQNPALTTVRQPLHEMGRIAAQTVLRRICNPSEAFTKQIVVEPELVARESTVHCSGLGKHRLSG